MLHAIVSRIQNGDIDPWVAAILVVTVGWNALRFYAIYQLVQL